MHLVVSVHLLPFYLLNPMTTDLDSIAYVKNHDHNLPGTEGQDHRSRLVKYKNHHNLVGRNWILDQGQFHFQVLTCSCQNCRATLQMRDLNDSEVECHVVKTLSTINISDYDY